MVYLLMADLEFNLDFFFKPTWDNETLKKIFLNNLPSYANWVDTGLPEEIPFSNEVWNVGGRGNNFGFRDDPFFKCADILMAGCSFTWGIGLLEKHVWPTHIKNMTGKTTANIGVSGGSIHGAVSRIFSYIRKFGKPKIIICLFPDAFRLYLPSIKNRFTNDRIYNKEFISNDNVPEAVLIDTGWQNYDNSTKSYTQPLYSKMPHYQNEILPAEVSFYLSIQQIHLLEQYCFDANIHLVWATWHHDTHLFFEKIKSLSDPTYFRYFIDITKEAIYTQQLNGPPVKDFGCHKELEKEDKETFLISADKHHWGSHSQIHIAETFYEHIKDKL